MVVYVCSATRMNYKVGFIETESKSHLKEASDQLVETAKMMYNMFECTQC